MKVRKALITAFCAIVLAVGCTKEDGPETTVAIPPDSLQCSASAATGWCWQQPQPDGLATRDVSFVDQSNGWLVGDLGLVMRSVDGGATWSRQAIATQSDLNKVRFVDARAGWLAAALGGEIWRTTDAGQSWARTSSQPVRVMQRIWALSDRVLVVTGNDGTDPTPDASAVTDDGGQTWHRAALVVDSVEADGTLWSVFGRSRSTDLGLTRTSAPPPGWPAGTFLNGVGFGPAGAAWARLDRYDATTQSFERLLARRTSATGSWTTQPLVAPAADPPHQLLSLSLDPNGPGLGIAWPDPLPSGDSYNYTRFARTTDGGLNWQWISPPAAGAVGFYWFIDPSSMQVALFTGTAMSLYLTTDGGHTWRDTLPQPVAPVNDIFRVERDGGLHLLGHTSRTPAEWSRSTDEGNTWRKVPSRHFDLSSISALWVGPDGKGTAIDQAGAVLDTQDFGRAWAKRGTPLSRPDDVLLRGDGSGWMLAGSQLSRTADGGKTWTLVPTAPSARDVPRRVLYAEGPVLRIEAVADCGGPSGLQSCLTVLHASDDGGQTWTVGTQTLREIGVFGARPTLAFATPEVAVRVTTTFEQRVDRSTDGGKTWSAVTLPALPGVIGSVQFQDANRGWMLGSNGLALRTLDAGATWSLVTLPAPAPRNGATVRPGLNAVLFANANVGWIVGDEGTVLATTDGGTTWTVQPSGTPYRLTTLFARDARRVWIGGEHGSIYASTTGGAASQ